MFTPFYFSSIRKYVTLFGTLFNDVRITKIDADHVTSLVRVPITYGPKEKMLSRVTQDPSIDRQTATLPLPSMSFEMTGMNYDGRRKLDTINRLAVINTDDKSKNKYQYTPVPYNISFILTIYAKNAEDGTKILEQILPYFTPDWTTTIHLIPEMNLSIDVPIVLNRVSMEDSYEGDFKERRAIMWILDFTLKGYFYGPIKSSKIIKFTNTEFFVASTDNIADAVGNSDPVAWIQIQPGLTANGQPTSNSALSIAVANIVATDDFGFVTTITETEY